MSASMNGSVNGSINPSMPASMNAVVNVVSTTVASAYVLTGRSDRILLNDMTTLRAGDRATTAALLAHLAEVDVRRLYLALKQARFDSGSWDRRPDS